jgi:DNA-binding NtrC family response regulator
VTSADSHLDLLLRGAPSLEPLRGRLERAAKSAAAVLVVGEPGSGRTTLARALHVASGRGGPLIETDVSTIPSALFESELFGHTVGAFSGADRARPGRVARASGGTLLLDQVEELPLETQPKLLRLLAEGRFAPLGGRERSADVRFLAVGAEDLPARVERGAFRRDLYYRLEVLAFRVPPLRARRGDLPLLISSLLEDLGRRYGRQGLALDPASRAWMASHPWPGNVRQLRNVLERAVVMHESGPMRVDPTPLEGDRPPTLLAVERDAILRALSYTRGHQGQAAEILGISRKALWEKRRRLGIP